VLLFIWLQTVDVSYVRGKDELHTVPLAQAVSISSSFLAVAAHDKSELAQELASTEKLVNWGVLKKQMDSEYLVLLDSLQHTVHVVYALHSPQFVKGSA
jgi:hypothetical protein